FCETSADHRRVARTDDGNRRLTENGGISLDRNQRRRGFTVFELMRVVRLPHSNQTSTGSFDGFKLALCVIQGRDADRTRAAASDVEIGQHFYRARSRAAKQNQIAKRDRADIVGSDETQPVETLAVGEANSSFRIRTFLHPLAPILLSVPFRRRVILVL